MKLIYLAAGAAALLLFKGPAKADQMVSGGKGIAVRRNPGQDYATPTGVAGDLARLVNIGIKGIASPASSTARGTVEAARTAVRSGDPYYSGQSAWFGDGLKLPQASEGFMAGWTEAGIIGVDTVKASAFGAAANPLAVFADNIAASPMYSPANDTDVLAAFGW